MDRVFRASRAKLREDSKAAATAPDTTTGLLARIRRGDASAYDDLFPLVYEQLHELAHIQRARLPKYDTLNTTALIHEAYIKLADHSHPDWRDRTHFMAVSARAMRQVLIDYVRARHAAKRGGGRDPLSFEEVRHSLRTTPGLTPERGAALMALDESLGRLDAEHPRQSRIVDCRFFGGMTIEDTADALGLSRATVKRGWAVARAWLYRDLKRSLEGED
jgi:RNA polymerase sigma factor (TIGR02999 family)